MASADEELRNKIQDLVWSWAREQPPGEHSMEADSPHEVGLNREQRRKAWLATLTGLEVVRHQVAHLAETAATRAVEYGADYPELGRAVGLTRQGARRRWPALPALHRLRGSKRRPPMADTTLNESLLNDPLASNPWRQ
jgi:hypothetical protein